MAQKAFRTCTHALYFFMSTARALAVQRMCRENDIPTDIWLGQICNNNRSTSPRVDLAVRCSLAGLTAYQLSLAFCC